jgi:hypothetical protein
MYADGIFSYSQLSGLMVIVVIAIVAYRLIKGAPKSKDDDQE